MLQGNIAFKVQLFGFRRAIYYKKIFIVLFHQVVLPCIFFNGPGICFQKILFFFCFCYLLVKMMFAFLKILIFLR